jgi:hypothetical protein
MRREVHPAKADDDTDPSMLLAEIVLDGAQPALEAASPTHVAALAVQGGACTVLVHATTTTSTTLLAPERTLIFLNEKAKVVLGRDTDPVYSAWYLDIGASNHMTWERASFVELNEAVRGSIKFGDGSVVQIMWRGTITLSINGGPR